MKLSIIAVGHRMPAWIVAGVDEYVRRLPREAALRLVELKPEARNDDSVAAIRRVLEHEAKRIRSALPAGATRIVLDERGEAWSTKQVAERLSAWRMAGSDVAFIIGGADGLDPALKAEADRMWSLSPLTLPHGLVRVILAEQIYRAQTLLQGHPYHRV